MIKTVRWLITETLQNWQQDVIWVRPQCALNCFGCRCIADTDRSEIALLGGTPPGYPRTLTDLVEVVRSGQFFEWHSHARVLNVMGADPLLDPHLMSLLEVLPEVSRHVRVWTPGVIDDFDWETALRFVVEWVIYLPALNAEMYREITGRDYADRVLARLEWLHRRGARVQVAHIPQAATLQDLTDLYDMCRRSGFELRLLVPQHHDLTPQGWAYVGRMRRCRGVTWTTVLKPHPHACLAISPARFGSLVHLKEVLSQLLARLGQTYRI